MILKLVEIKGFKSINKKIKISMDKRVTAFVGANEHGKTNILRALQALNEDVKFVVDDINQSCRNSSTNLKKASADFPYVIGYFTFDDNEKQEVEKILSNQLNDLSSKQMAQKEEKIKLKKQKVEFENNVARFEKAITKLETITKNPSISPEDLTTKTVELNNFINEFNSATSILKDNYSSIDTINEVLFNLKKQVDEIVTFRGNIDNLELVIERKGVKKDRNIHFFNEGKTIGIPVLLSERIHSFIPQLLFIDGFYSLGSEYTKSQVASPSDRASLNQMENDEFQSNLAIKGLFKLADMNDSINEIFRQSQFGRQKIDDGSVIFTDKIKKIWSQGNDVSFRFSVPKGGKFVIDIKDNTKTYNTPRDRSRGFLSFLYYYLCFYELSSELRPQGYIFLLDEPGIHLHPQGQKDLLEYFEELSDNNQIMYATHSIFLVDRNFPNRAKVISKKENEGTKINAKPFRQNWKPVRNSLGFVMGDLLYYAEKNVLCEGNSDRIYISCFSRIFNQGKRIKDRINQNKLSCISGDEHQDVVPLFKIMAQEGRSVVVLSDADGNDNVNIKRIKIFINQYNKDNDSKEEKIEELDYIMLNNIVEGNEVAIEDLIPTKRFIEVANGYITDLISNEIIKSIDNIGDVTASNLKYKAGSTKISKLLEKYISENYKVEKISKVGLARKFEDMVDVLIDNGEGFSDKQWSPIKDLMQEIKERLDI